MLAGTYKIILNGEQSYARIVNNQFNKSYLWHYFMWLLCSLLCMCLSWKSCLMLSCVLSQNFSWRAAHSLQCLSTHPPRGMHCQHAQRFKGVLFWLFLACIKTTFRILTADEAFALNHSFLQSASCFCSYAVIWLLCYRTWDSAFQVTSVDFAIWLWSIFLLDRSAESARFSFSGISPLHRYVHVTLCRDES